MTPDISAIAQKYSREAWKFPLLKSRVVTAMTAAIEEATASLRAQHESEVATLRRSLLESANLLDKAQQRWIPVSERLPEIRLAVLVYLADNKCTYTAYMFEDQWFHFAGNGQVRPVTGGLPTHWMPLPASPEVAQESPLNGKEGK